MNLHKKHEGETVKALKEFNSHLRNEIHELKHVILLLAERNQDLNNKLETEKKLSHSYFDGMILAQCECDRLIEVVEKLQAENAALKNRKGSIFTDPDKCRKLKQEGTEHDNT